MPKDYIQGGYYIKARCIQESDIAAKPPCVRETWDWLLRNANHADNGKLQRGQLVRTLSDIKEGLAWYVGYRKMTYSENQLKHSMKALRTLLMINATKTTRGMLITICNYERFQTPANYESTSESTIEIPTKAPRITFASPTINKNSNKEEVSKIELVNQMPTKRQPDDALCDFELFWDCYPKKTDKAKAQQKFKTKVRESNFNLVMAGVKKYKDEIKLKNTGKQYIKHAKSWLEGECWNNEYEAEAKKPIYRGL